MKEVKIDPPLSKEEAEALALVVEDAPVWCGSFPDAESRGLLTARGFILTTPIMGQDGHYVATPVGVRAYKQHFGTAMGGEYVSIAEVKAHRLVSAGLDRIAKNSKQGPTK